MGTAPRRILRHCVHITRRKHWSRPEGFDISRVDWRRFTEEDAELRPDGTDTVRWTGPCTMESPLLTWRDGNIEALDPDRALVAKMVKIADALGATAQGDAGEIHDPSGDPLPLPPERSSESLRDWLAMMFPRRRSHAEPVIRIMLVAWGLAGVLVVIAVIAIMVVRAR